MIAMKYGLFASIAMLLNLGAQYLCLTIYEGFGALYIAIFIGTAVGLITKYVLDKKFIFYVTPENVSKDASLFLLYTVTGVATTAIFWGTEILFDYYFKVEIAKYIGAVLGLSIGYVCKYFLDKKFVFGGETDEI